MALQNNRHSTGMSRRELIRNAGVAGAAAWTAPVILGSVSNAALATTGSGQFNVPTGCSYASVVFTTNNGASGPFAIRLEGSNCANSNALNPGNNDMADRPCATGTYSRCAAGGEANICRNGLEVPAYNQPMCPLTGNGSTFTANAGVTILFVAVHSGSCEAANGDKYCTQCGPMTSFTIASSCAPSPPA